MTPLDPLTITWNRQNPQAKMKPEHGSRFSHVCHNAGNILKFFNELVLFAKENCNSVKMQELSHQVGYQEETIKTELQALASCWFLILSPLWIKLRRSNAKASLTLIDDFTAFTEELQKKTSLPTSVKISNSHFNQFVNLDDTDQQFEPLSRDLVEMIQINQEKTQLNDLIEIMLKAAAAYMVKLSKNWVRDAIPDASIKFPFSNQVNSLYIFTCDYYI